MISICLAAQVIFCFPLVTSVESSTGRFFWHFYTSFLPKVRTAVTELI